jgi:hypothetical protein
MNFNEKRDDIAAHPFLSFHNMIQAVLILCFMKKTGAPGSVP